MLKVIFERLRQGHRTMGFPKTKPALPDRFRGCPVVDRSRCASDCADCQKACPTDAIRPEKDRFSVDLGRCLFCTACAAACPAKALRYSDDYRLSAQKRGDLVRRQDRIEPAAKILNKKIKQLFGRSLKLRQVSAGGCNGCESDINVLQTVVYDLGRFGISFVASPRHADGLLVTGPVTENMRSALLDTYQAVPGPKIVIALGACAISGGPYRGHPEVHNGIENLLPVDLFIPGCPPHPVTILDGLLGLVGKISDR